MNNVLCGLIQTCPKNNNNNLFEWKLSLIRFKLHKHWLCLTPCSNTCPEVTDQNVFLRGRIYSGKNRRAFDTYENSKMTDATATKSQFRMK